LYLLLRKRLVSLNCITCVASVLFVGLLLTGLATAAAEPDGQITGMVTDVSGSPISNVRVSVYNFTGDRWEFYSSANTDSVGQYTVGGLSSGDYRVCFQALQNVEDYLKECYNDARDVDHADNVAVTAGDTTLIDAQLAFAGMISGTVTNASGTPVASVGVGVWYRDGTKFVWVRWGVTDSVGQYTVGRLDSGDYRVCFADSVTGIYLPECYNDAPDINNADDVAVTRGLTTSGIDAQLAFTDAFERARRIELYLRTIMGTL